MRRRTFTILLLQALATAGCGAGGGTTSGNSNHATGSDSQGSTQSVKEPPTTITLSTTSSVITIPASSLTAASHFSIQELVSPSTRSPNRAVTPLSPSIQLASADATFKDDGTISASIMPNGSTGSTIYLITCLPSGLFMATPLPSTMYAPQRQAPLGPLTIPAAWLNLPGQVELWLYHLITGTNSVELCTDGTTAFTTPRSANRIAFLLHGFNQSAVDMEPLRATLGSLGWYQGVATIQYDETQRPDTAANTIASLIERQYPILFHCPCQLQLIGYSYGGIVAHLLAARLKALGSPLQIDSVLTIGSPIRGVPAASNLLASLVLATDNPHGRDWSSLTPAVRVLAKTDAPNPAIRPLLDQLATAPRTFGWTAIAGAAFPGLPKGDLTTEVLRRFAALTYPAGIKSDGIVADWSAAPVTPATDTAYYDPQPQADHHHLSLIDMSNFDRICRAATMPFGSGGVRISNGSDPIDDWNCYVNPSRPSAFGRYLPYETDLANNFGVQTLDRTVWLCDRALQTSELMSVLSDSSQMIGPSHSATVSSTGQFVAFVSDNRRSLTGETLTHENIYYRNRADGSTLCLTTNPAGQEVHPGHSESSVGITLDLAMTPDGRYLAYTAFGLDGYTHVFRYDCWTGERLLVDVAGGQIANGYASSPTISDDGSRICFQTTADNLGSYPRGASLGYAKVYVRDLVAQITIAVSVRPDGNGSTDHCENPMISGNGQDVVFTGRDPLLTNDTPPSGSWQIYHRNLTTTITIIASRDVANQPVAGYASCPSLSGNGRYVSYSLIALGNDPFFGSASDVILTDIAYQRSVCLTVNAAGQLSNGQCYWPCLAADGGSLLFTSTATSFDRTTPGEAVYVVANPLILPPNSPDRSLMKQTPALDWRRLPTIPRSISQATSPLQRSSSKGTHRIQRHGNLVIINGKCAPPNTAIKLP